MMVLQSGRVNYWTGQEGRKFEDEYAAFVGAKYSVALMNGSVALEAALSPRTKGIVVVHLSYLKNRSFLFDLKILF